MNTIELIKSNLNKLTKSEYAVALYFMDNPLDFGFETLDAIAEKINTSTTSVIRFCRKNGFSGYKALGDEVRKRYKHQLTLPDKLKIASSVGKENHAFSAPAQSAVSLIEKTLNEMPMQSIADAVSAVNNAKRVFCFGLKESFALSHYAYTRFLTVRSDVYMLSAGQSGEIESLLSLGKDDVCICFLFHRYTKQSPQIIECIKNQGAEVILITDPPYDEVEGSSSVLLPCYVDISGIKNSYAAPLCVVDCLCNAVVTEAGAKTLDYMKRSEELFRNFTF